MIGSISAAVRADVKRGQMRKLIYGAVTCLMAAFLLGGSQFIMPIFEPPVSAVTVFTPLHLYFMSPTGSDSNNGLTPATAWLTPNHPVVCGDVIIGAAGDYSSGAIAGNFQTFGTVSNCPSTSGGIDGMGGVHFATLLCAGPDLNSCRMNLANNATAQVAFNILSNNWAIEGWSCTGGGPSIRCYQVYACPVVNAGPGTVVHHVAFINDISINAGVGYDVDDCGAAGGINTIGGDYWAVVGSIAQNSASDPICVAAIDSVGPGQQDANAGTHHYFYGDFAYSGVNTACRTVSDTEGFMFDTWDAHAVVYQGVIANNVAFNNDRMCIQLFWQNKSNATPTMKVYNNTCFQNNTHTGGDFADGEININANGGIGTLPWITTVINNIAYQPLAASSPSGAVYAYDFGNAASSLTLGGTGSENIFKANNMSCVQTCDAGDNINSGGGAGFLGTNIYENPNFTNTTDLLANQTGAPNCTGFASVTACMGWNAVTQTLTTPSIISDLVPTAVGTTGKGYQLPSATCAANADYPTWLKGVVRLQWNASSSTITQMHDLVTTPCGL